MVHWSNSESIEIKHNRTRGRGTEGDPKKPNGKVYRMMLARCNSRDMAHKLICLGWLATVLMFVWASYKYDKDLASCADMLEQETSIMKEQNSIYQSSARGLLHKSTQRAGREEEGEEGEGEKEKEDANADGQERAQCQTVHLAFVCGGHNSTRDLYTLLKSILFYRTNAKLELHIFVNRISSGILRELFRTWLVPGLKVNYYNVSQYEHEIAWIPNLHYSHRFGLLKLIVPSVLADVAGLEQVILVDTDVLVMGNLVELWREFGSLKSRGSQNSRPFLGLVENQSDWYLNSSSSRPPTWPALGRGFNTGVILVDLVGLKRANWDMMWRSVAESELISYLSTSLADQDIYNAAIKKNAWVVARLDCRYNLQLNDHTDPDRVCAHHAKGSGGGEGGLLIVHWNSPNKLNTNNRRASNYYNSWHETFRNWDAKRLEREGCQSQVTASRDSHATPEAGGPRPSARTRKLDELCHELRPRPDERLRTFLNYLGQQLGGEEANSYRPTPGQADISIVVHLSLDRIRALDELASHWPGPISAAIYLSETDTQLFLESVESSESLAKRKNIAYHLIFRDHGFNYPINRLRNIALENSATDFVFMTDVDFLPALGLYNTLLGVIKNLIESGGAPTGLRGVALVVPAFESKEYKLEFPATKTDLIEQLDLGTVTKFRESLWPQGQAATDYDKWKVSTQPYEISWRPEYEPFVVTARNVTRYDERFNGFGWNKVQHIMQLAALNYKFLVLPEAFSIHQFHPASYDISMHRKSRKYQACIRLTKATFISEVRARHPGRFENMAL